MSESPPSPSRTAQSANPPTAATPAPSLRPSPPPLRLRDQSRPLAAPRPPLRPNPLAHLPLPFKGVDYAAKGYHLRGHRRAGPGRRSPPSCSIKRACHWTPSPAWTGWPRARWKWSMITSTPPRRCASSCAPASRATTRRFATIHKVFPGANWHERETHDFFGIRFLGHPNLTPFLLPEDATYHPLRKDFAA